MCLESIPYTSVSVLGNAILVAIFFLYPIFGMMADIWCGRYRMITIGMSITWAGAVLLTLYIIFFKNIYIITVLQSVQLAGIGIFQASALQFGTDQLKDVPSDQLSSFVHWYVWAQEISADSYRWISTAIDFKMPPTHSQLVQQLLVSGVISFALCFRVIPAGGWNFGQQLRENPYKLIFGVLKFAWRHKQPIKRSAFTFWEDNIPSRIELGKSKYGGPYTNENVEDVKTFFRISKLLLSLIGFFICRNGFVLPHTASSDGKFPQQYAYKGIVSGLVLFSLPLHELAIYPFTKSYYPGMVKRTFLGTILTLIYVCMTLIFYTITVWNPLEEQTVTWFTIIPSICGEFGYLIFTISILEFIVAQAPQSMRGLLIGVYYCIAYGISQFVAWLLFLPFQDHNNPLSYLTIVTAVGIVGFAIYARVASQYKNRERDEVVNVNLFAESYYGSRIALN